MVLDWHLSDGFLLTDLGYGLGRRPHDGVLLSSMVSRVLPLLTLVTQLRNLHCKVIFYPRNFPLYLWKELGSGRLYQLRHKFCGILHGRLVYFPL